MERARKGLDEFDARDHLIVRRGPGGAKNQNQATGARFILGDAKRSWEGAQGG